MMVFEFVGGRKTKTPGVAAWQPPAFSNFLEAVGERNRNGNDASLAAPSVGGAVAVGKANAQRAWAKRNRNGQAAAEPYPVGTIPV